MLTMMKIDLTMGRGVEIERCRSRCGSNPLLHLHFYFYFCFYNLLLLALVLAHVSVLLLCITVYHCVHHCISLCVHCLQLLLLWLNDEFLHRNSSILLTPYCILHPYLCCQKIQSISEQIHHNSSILHTAYRTPYWTNTCAVNI